MSDIKFVIGKNIAELRKSHGMTQLELAEKLNYSDKAVSKWERGEGTTDVLVLKEVADLFGVSVDYMLESEHSKPVEPAKALQGKIHTRGILTGISILLVVLVATLAFVIADIIIGATDVKTKAHWLAFIYAAPIAMIVWLVFNSIWFKKRRNFLIISLLMWLVLATFFITMLLFGQILWKIFLLGIPAQIIIVMWSHIKSKSK